jgi:hypothetical protein
MLELNGHLKPRVLSALIDRYSRWRKGRVCEGTDRYGNYTVAPFGSVVDRGTAVGTEAKRELCSFISYADVFSSRARDFEPRTIETSLLAEYATCSFLTGETMAHRYAKGLSLHLNSKLTAGA